MSTIQFTTRNDAVCYASDCMPDGYSNDEIQGCASRAWAAWNASEGQDAEDRSLAVRIAVAAYTNNPDITDIR